MISANSDWWAPVREILAKGDLPDQRRRKQVGISIASVVDWHLVIDVGSARRVEGPLRCRTYPRHVTSANGRNRRILVVAARSGEGPVTNRFADLSPRSPAIFGSGAESDRREPV